MGIVGVPLAAPVTIDRSIEDATFNCIDIGGRGKHRPHSVVCNCRHAFWAGQAPPLHIVIGVGFGLEAFDLDLQDTALVGLEHGEAEAIELKALVLGWD